MLGTAARLQAAHRRRPRPPTTATAPLLAQALRPFILRRTKEQVVKDLPEKTEQTLYCDLEPAQRKLYDELRAHYRQALLRKDDRRAEPLEDRGPRGAAAAAPGRLPPRPDRPDPRRRAQRQARHAPAAARRGRRGGAQGPGLLPVHQLPGDRPRAARRRRGSPTNTSTAGPATAPSGSSGSRTTPTCPIFLISLKAGGLGLNLTAAEYVYLLDPWWNPAVEAQAIDRSHRIGQTQRVFAYRLICRDTVEEKILELQQKKRDLADAILGGARTATSPNLTREDLEFLCREPETPTGWGALVSSSTENPMARNDLVGVSVSANLSATLPARQKT